MSNKNHQKNFALYVTSQENKDEKKWKIFIAHKKNELLENFQIFKNYIVLETRKNGLPQIVHVDKKKKKTYIKFKDPSYAAFLASSSSKYESTSFKYGYSSLNTPLTIYSYNSLSGKKENYGKKNLIISMKLDMKLKGLSLKQEMGKKFPYH